MAFSGLGIRRVVHGAALLNESRALGVLFFDSAQIIRSVSKVDDWVLVCSVEDDLRVPAPGPQFRYEGQEDGRYATRRFAHDFADMNHQAIHVVFSFEMRSVYNFADTRIGTGHR
jgi:hypothetical protein